MELTPNGLHLTTSELAQATNVTRKTIQDAISAGCPVISGGRKGVSAIINLADYMAWREGRFKKKTDNETTDTKSQLDAMRVEKAQLDLAERRGDLFHLADWQPLVEEIFVTSRNVFANVGREIIDEFSDVQRIAQVARSVHAKNVAAINKMIAELGAVPDKLT